jgi:hypothetical protein
MSKPVMYRQCELRRPSAHGEGTQRYVAWLPAEYRVGRIVNIDGHGDGWKIVAQGEARNRELVEAYGDNARRGLPSVTGHDKENA